MDYITGLKPTSDLVDLHVKRRTASGTVVSAFGDGLIAVAGSIITIAYPDVLGE